MADPFDPREIIRRADRLKAERATTESHWQEVADYILPAREFQTVNTPGSKRTAKIFHTGPVMAAEQLAGARHGFETSPALRWFAIRPDNPRVMEDVDVKAWFEDTTDRMYNHLAAPSARFDLNIHEGYLDEAAFGTSVLYIPDRGMRGPGYQALPLSESYFSEDDEGVIDTLIRCYKMRAQDVVGREGWSVPDDMRREATDKPDNMWDCVHIMQPDPNNRGGYAEAYILKKTLTMLGRIGRYRDKPFVVSRWSKRSGEKAGTGPGMNALPDVKMLNKLEEEHLMGVMLANAPPLAVPDDGFIYTLSQAPRALNPYRQDEMGFQDRVFPLNTGARPEIAQDKIMGVEARIERAFYMQWLSLAQKPNMTATEVLQRRDEMLRLMGPMASRSATEKLGPLIERTFGIMWRQGMLRPPPTSMMGMSWRVEYVSPLFKAQQSSDAQSALAYLEAIARISAISPQVVDIVDGDEYARILADRMGAPMQPLRSNAAIDEIRQARAQREQATQQAMVADSITKSLQQGGAGAASLAQAGATRQEMAA